MSTRLPDYRLKFLNKNTEERGEIGAAWRNDDGSITLVLDPKVYIGQDPAELLTLFPQDKKPAPKRAPVILAATVTANAQ